MGKQTRREFLKRIGFAAASAPMPSMLAGCVSIDKSRIAKKLPNIVFIFIDDLGWRDVGCYGSKYYETPNIDKLAAEGTVFTSAYANAPNCAPSRACLMSGQYTPRHGV